MKIGNLLFAIGMLLTLCIGIIGILFKSIEIISTWTAMNGAFGIILLGDVLSKDEEIR